MLNHYTNIIETSLDKSTFSSKSQQKEALGAVTWVYSQVRDEIQDIILNTEGYRDNKHLNDLYWDIPSYLHLWKAKHTKMFSEISEELVSKIEYLVAVRSEFKVKEVVKLEKADSEVTEMHSRVVKSVTELIEQRKAQYNHAIDLKEIFGDMGVSVTPHYVRNQHGTSFIRCFFFLNGKLTPLSVIMAALPKDAKKI